ncbi:serine hydrolase domain-containing protein [Ferruginibacter paludis]|uniref:serine hydrolase domain-containing protein n=1 Tax=Ferruginibacter paludis TaxID=1310417 RepID=UPI0025B2E08D|nr:serine hydrolase domain-containing protein [Ferruginibacter paludis]MDN3656221.1 serine hydrolase domain-containing protein [Ferruginibacter paludis]
MKCLFTLVILPFSLFAQQSSLDKYMQGQADLYGFNGNVLVAKNGVILYQKSFGYADYNTLSNLNENSIFDCGSIAKEFTSMAILLLKDKGKISYADTLRKFFPELPYTNVTIGQLLSHSAGIPDGFELVAKYFDHNKIATNDDLVKLLALKKPAALFKPGENVMYSGTGFNLLASIVEKVSGQSFKTYLDKQVFKPLGMTHTSVANGPRPKKDFLDYSNGFVYSAGLKKYVPASSEDSAWTTYFSGIAGEGMILTTTGDLLKWDRALKNHSLLTAATQQEMLSPHAQKVFPKVTFGYGMIMGQSNFGNLIFHNGYFPGFVSMHMRYTNDDVTVIVLSNNESNAPFIANGLAGITLNKEVLLPYLHKEVSPPHASVNYTGKYQMQLTRPPFMAMFPVEIINRNDSLLIISKFGADVNLKPESDKKFFFDNGTDQQIEFETKNDGSILHAWHVAWGVKKELKKVE